MTKQQRKSDCPINYAMEIFGDRWTFLIVRDLMFKGKSHYNEFLQSEEKIATNILANRLLSLEQNGIITKTTDPAHGSKWIYRLTDKGIDLIPLLINMILWSAKYDAGTAADQEFVIMATANRRKLEAQLKRTLKKVQKEEY
jgi:DNA-binding HxlR family transcriptional regulator